MKKEFRQRFWFNLLLWNLVYVFPIYITIDELPNISTFFKIVITGVIYVSITMNNTEIEILKQRLLELELANK